MYEVLRTVPGPRQELSHCSHYVIRAWHETYEQYELVPLVLFSHSQFPNGLVKM